MPLPPLYKFLNPEGAKLTLGNCTFRHAKPSDFDDDMDMTIENIFPVSIEVAAEQMVDIGIARIIFENLDRKPTCSNVMQRTMVSEMQKVFRANPDAVNIIENETKDDKADDIYDLQKMNMTADEFLDDLNDFLQGYRVLCVTDNKASLRMWKSYAANHTGVVIRITPNEAKDSKFKLFRKIDYVQARPTLYQSVREFFEDGLFGDQGEKYRMILDKIIYAKTLEFEFEKEYRLAVPLGPTEADYNTLLYHPEEVSELYLGKKMAKADKMQITALAKLRNPEIRIFQSSVDDLGKIVFQEL